ncbi:MAG: hypothetical protein RLZZ253_2720, partial [Verrucomicrobiota bacterium]
PPALSPHFRRSAAPSFATQPRTVQDRKPFFWLGLQENRLVPERHSQSGPGFGAGNRQEWEICSLYCAAVFNPSTSAGVEG